MLYFLGTNYSKVDLNYALFRSISCLQNFPNKESILESINYLNHVIINLPSLTSLHLDEVLSEIRTCPNECIESYLKKIINIKQSCPLSEIRKLTNQAYITYQLCLREILKNIADCDKNLAEFEIVFDNKKNIMYLESSTIEIIARVTSSEIELLRCIDRQSQETYLYNLIFNNYTEFSAFINNYRELCKTNSSIIEMIVR